MAISPPGDIVLDVIRAADPQRVRMALEKLQGAARTAGAAPTTDPFAVAMKAAARPARSGDPQRIAASLFASSGLHRGAAIGPTKIPKALRSLEAFMLRSMIETMMPSGKGSDFGAGAAGGVWRSFYAEAIADRLAAGQGVGVAASLLHRLEMDGRLARASCWRANTRTQWPCREIET